MRAVIYARYSTDNQRTESIEDQFEVCRRYIAQQGWTQTGTYNDAALSGSSRFRPGFQKLLADAEAKRFDVVVCEALDRLSRNLSDTANFYDRLTFAQVKLVATNVGEITPLHIGFIGTMAQSYITDLREKTKRGQLGRARAGKIPGGLAYGYEVVPPGPGETGAGTRRIIPAEAAIVRRIFEEYGAGKSARIIARELNMARIPGPGGRPWGDTTIRGQADRGTGILNNTLYIGQLSWNRCSYVKDPRTGKRQARVNPPSAWEVVDVPELRIVDQASWELARARQADIKYTMARDAGGNALNRAHRREFLLSGLLKCGSCGGLMTVIAQDRYGCATRRSKGTCNNNGTIKRQNIEARVLGALKERMITADLVAEFIRTFDEELVKFKHEQVHAEQRMRDRLADVQRKTKRIIEAIENGAYAASMNQQLHDLEAEEQRLRDDLAARVAPTQPPRLHPNAAEIYRHKVAELEVSLNAPEIRLEASEALRMLIDGIILTADVSAPDGMRAELYGDLAEILVLASDPEPLRRCVGGARVKNPRSRYVPEGLLSVVAGTRSQLHLLLETSMR